MLRVGTSKTLASNLFLDHAPYSKRRFRACFPEWRALCQSATFKVVIGPPDFRVGAGRDQARLIGARTGGIGGCALVTRAPHGQASPASDRFREGKVARTVPQKVPESAIFAPARPRYHPSSALARRARCQPRDSGFEPGPEDRVADRADCGSMLCHHLAEPKNGGDGDAWCCL